MKQFITAAILLLLIIAGCKKNTKISSVPEDETEETDPLVTDTIWLLTMVHSDYRGGSVEDSIQNVLYQLPADVGKRYLAQEKNIIEGSGILWTEYKLDNNDQLQEMAVTPEDDFDPAHSGKKIYNWSGGKLTQVEYRDGTGKLIKNITYEYETRGTETFIRVKSDEDNWDRWEGDHLASNHKFEKVFVVSSADFKPLRLETYDYSYNQQKPEYPQHIKRDTLIANLTISDQGNLEQIVFRVSNTDTVLTKTDQGWQETATQEHKRITGNYIRDNGKTGMGYFMERLYGKKLLPYMILDEVEMNIVEVNFAIPYMLSGSIRFLDYIGQPAKMFFTTLNSVTDAESSYNFENTYDADGRLLFSKKTDEDDPDRKSIIELTWPDK